MTPLKRSVTGGGNSISPPYANELPVAVTHVPATPDDGDTERVAAAIPGVTARPARNIARSTSQMRNRRNPPDSILCIRSGTSSRSLFDLLFPPIHLSQVTTSLPGLQEPKGYHDQHLDLPCEISRSWKYLLLTDGDLSGGLYIIMPSDLEHHNQARPFS